MHGSMFSITTVGNRSRVDFFVLTRIKCQRGRASDRRGLGVSRSGWEQRRRGEAASLVAPGLAGQRMASLSRYSKNGKNPFEIAVPVILDLNAPLFFGVEYRLSEAILSPARPGATSDAA